ncbi:MAG TPA: zf-HC2 domain-containing protein [Candidatus Cybelea sp.]
MDSSGHIGEAAELYALGALDEHEQAEVEAHVARCAACLRRVGEAEETLLALERGSKAIDPPRSRANVLPMARPRTAFAWWMPAAIAAAFVLGLLLPRAVSQPGAATLAMINSHFSHAQFSGNGPPAKVIYARDRSWYYVIVSGSRRFDVYGVRGTQATRLGTTAARGETSELFIQRPGAFARVELRAGAGFVESASIR